jgi:hypothetical protein
MKVKLNRFPPGWDEERVRAVIAHYEKQKEEEAVAEDEARFGSQLHTLMNVPHPLVPLVREIIALHSRQRRRRSREPRAETRKSTIASAPHSSRALKRRP